MAVGAWQDVFKLTCLQERPVQPGHSLPVLYSDGVNEIVMIQVILISFLANGRADSFMSKGSFGISSFWIPIMQMRLDFSFIYWRISAYRDYLTIVRLANRSYCFMINFQPERLVSRQCDFLQIIPCPSVTHLYKISSKDFQCPLHMIALESRELCIIYVFIVYDIPTIRKTILS
jgi:hypothetical protein